MHALALTRSFVMCSATGSEAVQEVETGNIVVPVLYKTVEGEYFCRSSPVLKAEGKYLTLMKQRNLCSAERTFLQKVAIKLKLPWLAL